jgi:hypothetical protein
MEFDADKDGKLNRDELMKFAENIPQMRRGSEGPGGPGGGSRPGGPDGDRPRPERPARPE